MKTVFIALISTLIMFNGANAQTNDGRCEKPHFLFKLGHFMPGKILLDDVKKIRDLKVFSRCPLHPDALGGCVGILQFKLVIVRKDGTRIELYNNGPYLNPTIIEILKRVKVDDEILVPGVKIKVHGKIITLPLLLKYKVVSQL